MISARRSLYLAQYKFSLGGEWRAIRCSAAPFKTSASRLSALATDGSALASLHRTSSSTGTLPKLPAILTDAAAKAYEAKPHPFAACFIM